jgi:hypothetical protein
MVHSLQFTHVHDIWVQSSAERRISRTVKHRLASWRHSARTAANACRSKVIAGRIYVSRLRRLHAMMRSLSGGVGRNSEWRLYLAGISSGARRENGETANGLRSEAFVAGARRTTALGRIVAEKWSASPVKEIARRRERRASGRAVQ